MEFLWKMKHIANIRVSLRINVSNWLLLWESLMPFSHRRVVSAFRCLILKKNPQYREAQGEISSCASRFFFLRLKILQVAVLS